MSSKFGGEVSFRCDFPIFLACADQRSLAVPGLGVGGGFVVHGRDREDACPVLAAHRPVRPHFRVRPNPTIELFVIGNGDETSTPV